MFWNRRMAWTTWNRLLSFSRMLWQARQWGRGRDAVRFAVPAAPGHVEEEPGKVRDRRSKAKGWITLVEPSNFVPQKKKAGWPQIGLWVERLGPTLRKDRENTHAALFRATRLIFIRRLEALLESLMKNERFPGEAFVGWHTATRRPGLVLVEVLAHSIERYTVS